MVEASFAGFPRETFKFLKGLGANNSKVWFDEHRSDYDTFYLTPARDFVAALGPRLQKISPDVQFAPKINGSIFRINRDVRFSKDKTPYKDHLDMWFWHGERRGWGAPGFYFRLAGNTMILGAGMHRFEKPQLEAFRQAVIDPKSGPALDRVLAKVTGAGPYTLGKANRKTVPRGFDKTHQRAGLLLHDGLTVGFEGKVPAEVKSAAFVGFCADHFKVMNPLVKWQLENLSGGS